MGWIRILLALAVVLEHAQSPFRPLYGPLAVQGFYLISGFYIQLIVSGRYFTPGSRATRTQLAHFYESRLMRLFPGYFLCIFIMIILLLVAGPRMRQGLLLASLADANWPSQLLYMASTFFIVGSDVLGRFLHYDEVIHEFIFNRENAGSHSLIPGASFLLIPQAWSLSLEIMFYLLAPFLLRRRLWVLLACIGASFYVRWLLPGHGILAQPWINSFFPAELGLFLLGAVACRFWRFSLGRERPVVPQAKWLGWLAALLLYGYAIAYHRLPGELEGSVKYWLFLLCLWLLLPLVFHASRHSAKDRWVGELSYPVYLVHFIFIYVVRYFVTDPNLFPALIALGSLAAAVMMARWVDGPVMRYRHRKYLGTGD